LVVNNVGQVAANSVRAEVSVPTDIGVMLIVESDLPDAPKRRADFVSHAAFKNIRPAFLRSPGDVTIDKNAERFRVEIDCGCLQPGRRVWSDVFYIGKGASGDLPLSGQVFAENLPQPKDFTLTASVSVAVTQMTIAELRFLPEAAGEDD
jgi:hypothetical protein